MQKDVVNLYRSARRLVVRVGLAPDQDISSGKIILLVTIGRLGTVTVSGAKYFSNERMASFIQAKPGEYIDSTRDWNLAEYGSIDAYLREGLGHSAEEIERLRDERLD